MNTAALLTLVATILSAEGSFIQIDVGSSGGLRVGDPGIAYYELATTDGVEFIDVGLSTVVAVVADRAVLRVDPGGALDVGQLVRFEIPEQRLAESAPPPAGVIASATVDENLQACLHVRELPGTFARSLACLEPGTKVAVLTSIGEWTRARLSNSREGWLATKFLATSEIPARRQESVAVSDDLASRLAEVEAVLADSERTRRELLGSLDGPSTVGESEGSGNERLDLADTSIRELQQQLLRSEAEFDDAQRSHEDLSQRVTELTVETLETRLEESQATARNAEITRRRLADEVSDLADENDSLRLRLATAETLREEAESARQRLETELDLMRPIAPAEREVMRAETEHRKAALQRSQEALEQAERRILELEREIEAMNAPEDVEKDTPRRRSRWKFWTWWRSSDGDAAEPSEAGDDSGVDGETP